MTPALRGEGGQKNPNFADKQYIKFEQKGGVKKSQTFADVIYSRPLNVLIYVIQGQQSEQYLENVRKVGVDLRQLLSAVDLLVPVFPTPSHRQVRYIVHVS